MIDLINLTKEYGSFRAVNQLNLSVHAGEIFGFLGVNGAGKTTTLRMLAGILKPTSGSIKIGGFDMQSEPDAAKRITGFIPDRPHLYSKLTAREFLYFISELYEIPAQQAENKIEQLLSDYRLKDWQDDLVESFSHGMKQRLATCAALIHNPKVLIVDEPMVGLDPHGSKMLKESFRQYAKDGMAILLSTHSLNVAAELCDRLAIIHRGNIISLGTLKEIREQAGSNQEDLEQIFLQITNNLSSAEYT